MNKRPMRLSIFFLLFIICDVAYGGLRSYFPVAVASHSHSVSHSQKPDSVLVNGQWRYVYPIAEDLTANRMFQRKTGLIYTEFEQYRTWRLTDDQRWKLKGRKLHEALKAELLATNRITEEKYNEAKDDQGRFLNPFKAAHFRKHPEAYMWEDDQGADYLLDPSLIDLPDGLYLQYFEEMYTFRELPNTEPLPKRVACLFELKGNVLQGSFLRLTKYGDTLSYGQLNEGAREGLWQIAKTEYIYETRSYHFVCEEEQDLTINYQQGQIKGPYTRAIKDGMLLEKGALDGHGKLMGNWSVTQLDDTIIVHNLELVKVGDSLVVRNLFQLSMDNFLYRSMGTTDPNIVNPDCEADVEMERIDYGLSCIFDFSSHTRSQIYNPIAGDLRNVFPDRYEFYRDGYRRYDPDTNKVFITNVRSAEGKWLNGKTAYRYRYDVAASCYVGVQFYPNGQLLDTIFQDQTSGNIVRRVYTRQGLLYMERRWKEKQSFTDLFYNEVGQPVSGVVYLAREERSEKIDYLPLPKVEDTRKFTTIEGFTAEVVKGREWVTWTATAKDSLIGNRRYRNISWYKKTGVRAFENYIDLADERQHRMGYNDEGILVYESINLQGDTLEYEYRGDTCKFLRIEKIFFHEMTIISRLEPGMPYNSPLIREMLINDKPYTGKIVVNFRAKRLSLAVDDQQLVINIPEDKKRSMQYNAEGRWTGPGHYYQIAQWLSAAKCRFAPETAVTSFTGFLENSIPTGTWHFDNEQGGFDLTYTNGLATGHCLDYHEDWRWKSDGASHTLHKLFVREKYYLRDEFDLKDGELNGVYITRNEENEVVSMKRFENSELHGEQEAAVGEYRTLYYHGNYVHGKKDGEWIYGDRFDGPNDQLTATVLDTCSVLHFVNDTLDGKAMIIFDTLRIELSYRKGVLDGTTSVYKNGELDQQSFAENGWLIRKDYYKNGALNSRYVTLPTHTMPLVFDHGKWHLKGASAENTPCFRNHYSIGSIERDSLFKEPNNAYFTKFYPNGNVHREGILSGINGPKGQHCDSLWKFYSYEGHLLYSIDFVDTLLVKANDTFAISGYYTEYNAEGQIYSLEAIRYERQTYDCTADNFYQGFEFITLPQSAERQSDWAKHYYDNGMLMSEGMMENGLPVGVWKLYTPDGKLNGVGRYEKGHKDGRWLYGDLAESAYIGDICLNPDSEDLDFRIADLQRNHNVTVEVYKDGQPLTSQDYFIRK